MEYRKGSHSIYNLKYHIIFCTKYRYRVLTGEVSERLREIIREVSRTDYVEIISGSISPDHVHVLLSIPPSISLSKVMQYMKGKSSRKLLDEYKNLRKRYWGQHLWARGYFAVTVGDLNSEEVQRYIENQEIEQGSGEIRISSS
jgi:putative transposase